MIQWHLEVLPIKILKDHPKNPRQISKEQYAHLETLIKKFGLIDKPIVNTDHTIIGGHQRVKILRKMKAKTIECWVPDAFLEQADIDHLCIGLNLNQGSFDFDILESEWDSVDLLGWGFTEEQLLGLKKEEESLSKPLEDEEEELEPGKEEGTISKLGDLYVLGDHRLVCGDSSDENIVKLAMGTYAPILMVTDPPYGVNYDPNWRNNLYNTTIKNTGIVLNDNKFDFSESLKLFNGNVSYIWNSGKHLGKIQDIIENIGFDIINQIIWNKDNFTISRGNYHWKHESCFYCVRNGKNHNFYGDRKQTTVWDIACLQNSRKNPDNESQGHGTQKPLECMARPIRNNSATGDAVYDPFLGSGTTLIASEILGRKCVGIELSPVYCDMIVNRWIKHRQRTGKPFSFTKNGIEMDELSEGVESRQ